MIMDLKYIWSLVLVVFSLDILVLSARNRQWQRDDGSWANRRTGRNKKHRSDKPNIVFIITDDQDSELGSMNFMPKTTRILGEGGAHFHNAFVSTPMCCPSRSSMLTGMYVHNHNVYTNNDNCSSVQWQTMYETRAFSTYLSNAGYRTGYFGKYLNEYQGTYIPPGWTEWVGLIRNTRFYNYSINFNGKKVKHYDDYHKDYLTDLIANDSVTFLKQSKQYFPNRPVAMVLSMPAPHGPEDSAPQYQNMFMNVTTHKTPSYNFAPNPDKQWILQHTGKMEPIHKEFTDLLHSKRLQTLQSVDDAVEKVYNELKDLGELDNTYIIYSSDHGYHLGQYGLIKGKAMPYEFDIRVPFYMRGPKVPNGVKVPNIALNIDLAPTFLDIAGVPVPEHMDGRSLLKLFEGMDGKQGVFKRRKAWRDSFLVERGKITTKKILNRERLEAKTHQLNVVATKEQRLIEECQKAEYKPPCSPTQEWECRSENGRVRMFKCRKREKSNVASMLTSGMLGDQPVLPRRRGRRNRRQMTNAYLINEDMCLCPWQPSDVMLAAPSMNREEKQRQRQFLKHNVNKPKRLKAKFLKHKMDPIRRVRRDLSGLDSWPANETVGQPPMMGHPLPRDVNAPSVACHVLPNNTVVCERDVYSDVDAWKTQKEQVDQMIQEYKQRLDALKDVRRHLKKQKPTTPEPWDDEDEDEPLLGYDEPAPDPLFTEDLFDGPKKDNLPEYQEPLSPDVYDTDDTLETPVEVRPPVDDPELLPEVEDGEDREDGYIDTGYVFPTHMNEDKTKEEKVEDENSQLAEYLGRVTVDEEGKEWCPCDIYTAHDEEDGDLEDLDESDDIDSGKKKNRKKNKLLRRERKRKERERIRAEKQERRRNRGEGKVTEETETPIRGSSEDGVETFVNPTRDCNSPKMKCFTHDNEHWKTAPLWNLTGLPAGYARSRRKDPACNMEGLECARMDNDHWKVAPRWTLGPFCFCPNSNNNTYWCLRTINETHNFLYCEFITGFISFYDIIRDPYQLRNAVHDLSFAVLQQLSTTLEHLKGCKGSRECTVRARPQAELSEIGSDSDDLDNLDNDYFRPSSKKWGAGKEKWRE